MIPWLLIRLGNSSGVAPTPSRTPGWIPESHEDADRRWRESHEYYRKQDRLAAAERAASEQADKSRSEKKKNALRAAVAATELLPPDIPDGEASKLAALLESAATAQRTANSVRRSRAAILYANELAARIELEQDEEEAIMLLML